MDPQMICAVFCYEAHTSIVHTTHRITAYTGQSSQNINRYLCIYNSTNVKLDKVHGGNEYMSIEYHIPIDREKSSSMSACRYFMHHKSTVEWDVQQCMHIYGRSLLCHTAIQNILLFSHDLLSIFVNIRKIQNGKLTICEVVASPMLRAAYPGNENHPPECSRSKSKNLIVKFIAMIVERQATGSMELFVVCYK